MTPRGPDLLPDLTVRLPLPELGRWREGNTGTPGLWRFTAPTAGPHLLVTGLVHGNEIAGAALLVRWLEVGLRPARGTLSLCFCNLAAFDRFDVAAPTASRFVEEDMNRLWDPLLLAGPRRSVELDRARALLPAVQAADALLDLHSMLWPSDPLLLAGRGAADLAAQLGTPGTVVLDEGHAAGLRLIDHPHFDADRPAILLEAGQHWEPATLAQMEDTAARWLRGWGTATPGPAPSPLPRGRIARVIQTVTARTDEFAFVMACRGGDVVGPRNSLLALDGEIEVRTPHADCLLVMPSPRALRGHTAVRLARFQD